MLFLSKSDYLHINNIRTLLKQLKLWDQHIGYLKDISQIIKIDNNYLSYLTF
jgi:hypothetical protein